jgi:hypothetical protein
VVIFPEATNLFYFAPRQVQAAQSASIRLLSRARRSDFVEDTIGRGAILLLPRLGGSVTEL